MQEAFVGSFLRLSPRHFSQNSTLYDASFVRSKTDPGTSSGRTSAILKSYTRIASISWTGSVVVIIMQRVRGKKMRTLASKKIRIQKTSGKIVIDNNQKPTEVIFYYLFDIISLLRRNRRKFIRSQSFYCIYRSETKRRLGLAGDLM